MGLIMFQTESISLHGKGYPIVPILPNKKFPGFDEWEKYTFSAPDAKSYARYGTGILTGQVREWVWLPSLC